MKPVENRRLGDTSIDENAPKPWTTIGEGRQVGAFNSSDGVEAPAYQRLDVRVGFRDGAENQSTTGLRLDVANPHLQMTFSILATSDEHGIQGDRDCRRRCFRPGCGTIRERFASPHGVAAQRFGIGSGVDRKHTLEQVSGHPVGHQGGEMRPDPVQFRRRSAVRWPADASLGPTTPGTAKSGQLDCDLTALVHLAHRG
jgi:hypothetical protein